MLQMGSTRIEALEEEDNIKVKSMDYEASANTSLLRWNLTHFLIAPWGS
jgi:hypothetical protein